LKSTHQDFFTETNHKNKKDSSTKQQNKPPTNKNI
jgi:hypothetical protein